MDNVVPFPRASSRQPDNLGHDVRRAILLLDMCIDQTAESIDACPPGNMKEELKDRLLKLRTQLDVLRLMARTLFAASD
jgi:hypothetical protein